MKIVLSTKISSWKNIETFLFRIKRLHGGIVKRQNEKEIFIVVLLKNVFIYGQFYTKNYKTIFFLAQLHVITCPEMLEWSCLYDKEMNLNFRAQS